MSMATEIVLIVVLVLANGGFAMAEIAIVAARRARLEQRVKQGDAGARVALELAAAPSELLATSQVGITLIGILAGAFGGATVAARLAAALRDVPWIGGSAEELAFVLVVAAITWLSVVLGELVPKQIALAHAEPIAAFVARPLRALGRAGRPVVLLLSGTSTALLRALRVRTAPEPTVTEEEIKVLLDQGARAGALQRVERTLIDNVLRLGDLRVRSLMTHRADVAWLDLGDAPAEIARKVRAAQHSRFPVAEGDLDHVIGVVRAKDLLPLCLAGTGFSLRELLHKPLFVPESLPAFRALELFRAQRPHIALVLDEHGGLQGLVTIGDILEGIVGDLPELGQPPEREAVQRADGSWLIEGSAEIERVRGLLALPPLSSEQQHAFVTLAGFVLWHLGRIPRASDAFEAEGWRFEVVDMDGQRVDKVLAARIGGIGGES